MLATQEAFNDTQKSLLLQMYNMGAIDASRAMPITHFAIPGLLNAKAIRSVEGLGRPKYFLSEVGRLWAHNWKSLNAMDMQSESNLFSDLNDNSQVDDSSTSINIFSDDDAASSTSDDSFTGGAGGSFGGGGDDEGW